MTLLDASIRTKSVHFQAIITYSLLISVHYTRQVRYTNIPPGSSTCPVTLYTPSTILSPPVRHPVKVSRIPHERRPSLIQTRVRRREPEVCK